MAKSLSGEELRKMPAELQKQKEEIAAKQSKLDIQQVENLAKLAAIEADVQKQCQELDKKDAEVSAKILHLEKLQGMSDSKEAFSAFYEHINSMYTIWVAAGGSEELMFDAIKKIIEARQNMFKLKN